MNVTIAIPVFNQKPEYFVEAANSALDQTVPCEVIVVDDGSDPAIPFDPAGPDNLTIIRQANKGIAAALNESIKHCTTDWWCWLSSDDLAFPEKVQRQLEATVAAGCKASYHRYGMVGGVTLLSHRPLMSLEKQMQRLWHCCYINGSTVMIHKDVFQEVGVFDPSFKYSQDWEFWCRVGRKFPWFGVDEVLGYRREDGNLTARIEADPLLKAARDAEDLRVREMYQP